MTPIEALAQEYCSDKNDVNGETFDAFMAGAKAASGRVAELEAALKQLLQSTEDFSEKTLKDYNFVDVRFTPQEIIDARQALSGAGKGEAE